MSESYKFVSEITKAALPMGMTTTSHIKREEVPAILEKMKKLSINKFSNWGEMFFGHCLGEYGSWGEDAVLRNMRQLQSDILQLTMLLIVNKPTTSQQESTK